MYITLTIPFILSMTEVEKVEGGISNAIPPARSIAEVYVEGKIAASIVHFANFDSLMQQVTPISGLSSSGHMCI